MNDLYYLVRVVDADSFAAAVREFGTTRSLLSRRIIALEKAPNARLLVRDSRHFTVTRTGKQVYKQAVLLAATRADTGFAQLPLHACHEAIASGHLQIVCEAFEPDPLPLHALTPAQPAPGKKQTGFIDFVREQLTNKQAHGVLPIDS